VRRDGSAFLVALVFLLGSCSPTPSRLPTIATSTSTPGASADASPSSTLPASGPLARASWEVLLDRVGGGTPATIAVALGVATYVETWLETFPGQVVHETTMEDPIFVFFHLLVPFTCPEVQIDDLSLDLESGLLYGVFTRLGQDDPRCGDTGGTHSFVVAVSRAALPTGQLTIRLEREFSVCDQCGREREQVEVHL
jgi:hypothetical protein